MRAFSNKRTAEQTWLDQTRSTNRNAVTPTTPNEIENIRAVFIKRTAVLSSRHESDKFVMSFCQHASTTSRLTSDGANRTILFCLQQSSTIVSTQPPTISVKPITTQTQDLIQVETDDLCRELQTILAMPASKGGSGSSASLPLPVHSGPFAASSSSSGLCPCAPPGSHSRVRSFDSEVSSPSGSIPASLTSVVSVSASPSASPQSACLSVRVPPAPSSSSRSSSSASSMTLRQLRGSPLVAANSLDHAFLELLRSRSGACGASPVFRPHSLDMTALTAPLAHVPPQRPQPGLRHLPDCSPSLPPSAGSDATPSVTNQHTHRALPPRPSPSPLSNPLCSPPTRALNPQVMDPRFDPQLMYLSVSFLSDHGGRAAPSPSPSLMMPLSPACLSFASSLTSPRAPAASLSTPGSQGGARFSFGGVGSLGGWGVCCGRAMRRRLWSDDIDHSDDAYLTEGDIGCGVGPAASGSASASARRPASVGPVGDIFEFE